MGPGLKSHFQDIGIWCMDVGYIHELEIAHPLIGNPCTVSNYLTMFVANMR